jgi:hypothetical protein
LRQIPCIDQLVCTLLFILLSLHSKFKELSKLGFSELGSENLRTMIYIIQSYILLAPEQFLTNCGAMISAGLQVNGTSDGFLSTVILGASK